MNETQDPAARIAQLEAQLAQQAAEIATQKMYTSTLEDLYVRRADELAQQAAEIERLRAGAVGTWQPITDENTELIDENADDDRRLYIHDCGESIEFTCESGELEGWFSLPAGYAVCRQVQP